MYTFHESSLHVALVSPTVFGWWHAITTFFFPCLIFNYILVSGSPSQFLNPAFYDRVKLLFTEALKYSGQSIHLKRPCWQTAISMFSLLLLRRKKQSRHPRSQNLWGKQAPLLKCFYRMCRSYIWLVISRSAFSRSVFSRSAFSRHCYSRHAIHLVYGAAA